MEDHGGFWLEWFSVYGRELGNPARWFTDNPSDLISLVECCATEGKPCFCTVQPYRTRNVPLGLEKVFFDFDSKRHFEAKRKIIDKNRETKGITLRD